MPLFQKYRDDAGRINDDGVREIARRVKLGHSVKQVAAEIGLSESAARVHWDRIRIALRVPSRADARAKKEDRFLALVEQGLPPEEIERRLGLSANQVRHLRDRLGCASFRKLNVTDEEIAEIERRLHAGERPVEIARAIGVTASSVRRHIETLSPNPAARSCACGRAWNHSGACRLLPDAARACEDRLKGGASLKAIASELGYSIGGLRLSARSIVKRLRADGVACICGKPLLHMGSCRDAVRNPNLLAPEFLAFIEQKLQLGRSRRAIALDVGLDPGVVYRLAAPILARWAEEGRKCGCGQPINHSGRCGARCNPAGSTGGRRKSPVTFSTTSRKLTDKQRVNVQRMAERGRSDAFIAEKLGISRHFVRSVILDVAAGGAVFRPCRCGKPRNHGGMCSVAPAPARRKAQPKPLEGVPKGVRFSIYSMMKYGTSAEEMARKTGISIDRIRDHIRLRIRDRKRPLPPCKCGRPAYHQGYCSKTVPGAMSTRWVRRIEQMAMEGKSVAVIADELRITFRTAAKYALPLREKQVAAGIVCACGRPVGHQGVCSATWDSAGRRRGFVDLPKALARRVRKALLNGSPPREAAALSGASYKQVLRSRMALDDVDRAQRAASIRRRARFQHDEAESELLMQKVKRAIPHWAEAGRRDDIKNELYLAVIDGRIEEDQLRRAAIALAAGARRHDASLDAELGEDGGPSLHDFVGDTTAANQIDDISIGEYEE